MHYSTGQPLDLSKSKVTAKEKKKLQQKKKKCVCMDVRVNDSGLKET